MASVLFVYARNPDVRERMRESLKTRRWTDSGFDIPLIGIDLNDVTAQTPHCIPQGVYVGAVSNYGGGCLPSLLLPRSSLSKTPYRLSNSIGLIDAGYRGEVKAMVDIVGEPTEIPDGTRLFQLVAHDFLPWWNIIIVDSMDELPKAPDQRGDGGFGSTGQ